MFPRILLYPLCFFFSFFSFFQKRLILKIILFLVFFLLILFYSKTANIDQKELIRNKTTISKIFGP